MVWPGRLPFSALLRGDLAASTSRHRTSLESPVPKQEFYAAARVFRLAVLTKMELFGLLRHHVKVEAQCQSKSLLGHLQPCPIRVMQHVTSRQARAWFRQWSSRTAGGCLRRGAGNLRGGEVGLAATKGYLKCVQVARRFVGWV